MHRDIGHYKSLVRSGHSAGTIFETYLDQKNLALSLSGGLALNYWSNVHESAHTARLSCLGESNCKHAENMMDTIFIISHPDFVPNGVLQPVLYIAFASLLMYYPNTLKEFEMSHVLTIALRNTAISSKIKTSQTSSPSSVLLILAD